MSQPRIKQFTADLEFAEIPLFLPYEVLDRIHFPANRKLILGPGESKTVQFGIKFKRGMFSNISNSLSRSQVQFLSKTNVQAIWGIIRNLSQEPVRKGSRSILFCVKSSAVSCWTPDRGEVILPWHRTQPVRIKARKPTSEAMQVISQSVNPDTLRRQFSTLFSNSIGCAQNFILKEVELKTTLPRFQRTKGFTTGSAENRIVMQEVEKLLIAGIVREIFQEPQFCTPIFAVRKKEKTQWRVLLDFRRLNSLVNTHAETGLNRGHLFSQVQSFQVATVSDIANAYHQVRVDQFLQHLFSFGVHGRWF